MCDWRLLGFRYVLCHGRCTGRLYGEDWESPESLRSGFEYRLRRAAANARIPAGQAGADERNDHCVGGVVSEANGSATGYDRVRVEDAEGGGCVDAGGRKGD